VVGVGGKTKRVVCEVGAGKVFCSFWGGGGGGVVSSCGGCVSRLVPLVFIVGIGGVSPFFFLSYLRSRYLSYSIWFWMSLDFWVYVRVYGYDKMPAPAGHV